MKKIETREVTVYYCDICGKECGLPYCGYDSVGFGDCCASLMRKLEKAEVIDELREKIPVFGKFWSDREAVQDQLAKEESDKGEA